MRVVAWNVGPRVWPKFLRSLLGIKQARRAHVVALFEAAQLLFVVALRARYPGRRVIWRRTDVVALVRRRDEKPRVEIVEHHAPWTGPHLGRRKIGRRWLLLIWEDAAVLLVHRVTPIGNERAWAAETRLIRQITEREDLPENLAVIGDHNGTRERLSVEYAAMGLRLLPAKTKVDQAAVRGMRGEGMRLGRHDSDHVAMLWLLFWERLRAVMTHD